MRALMLLPLLAAGCAPPPPIAIAPADDPALIEALFNDARTIEKDLAPGFACLSIHDGTVVRDPPLAIVGSLSRRWKVPVYAGSQCRQDDTGVLGPAGSTGTGKWLRVINLQCSSADHCAADVSYYVANLGIGGRGVTAERTPTGWQITPTNRVWIG